MWNSKFWWINAPPLQQTPLLEPNASEGKGKEVATKSKEENQGMKMVQRQPRELQMPCEMNWAVQVLGSLLRLLSLDVGRSIVEVA